MIKLNSGALRFAKYTVPLAALAVAGLGIAFAIGKFGPESADAAFGHGRAEGPARLALIVANADYPEAHAPLRHPVKDAQALAETLRRNGFSVDLKANLGGAQMKRTIEGFKSRIKPGSVAFVYFGGYGIQVGRQSYMIPVDAKIWNEADVRRDGISVDSVLSDLHRNGAGVKLAILDGSRRNPFERRFRGFSAGLTAIDAPAGTLLLSAAAPSKVVDETAGAHSLLMGELLKEIEAPGISAEAVFNRTRIGVSRASNGEQVPLVSSSLVETFSFATPGGVAKRAAAERMAVLTTPAAEPALLHVTDATEKASTPAPVVVETTATASVDNDAPELMRPVEPAVLPQPTVVAQSTYMAEPTVVARETERRTTFEEVRPQQRPVREVNRETVREVNRETVHEHKRPTTRRGNSYAAQPARNWRLAQSVFSSPVLGIGY